MREELLGQRKEFEITAVSGNDVGLVTSVEAAILEVGYRSLFLVDGVQKPLFADRLSSGRLDRSLQCRSSEAVSPAWALSESISVSREMNTGFAGERPLFQMNR